MLDLNGLAFLIKSDISGRYDVCARKRPTRSNASKLHPVGAGIQPNASQSTYTFPIGICDLSPNEETDSVFGEMSRAASYRPVRFAAAELAVTACAFGFRY
jgi:hypothetical protein